MNKRLYCVECLQLKMRIMINIRRQQLGSTSNFRIVHREYTVILCKIHHTIIKVILCYYAYYFWLQYLKYETNRYYSTTFITCSANLPTGLYLYFAFWEQLSQYPLDRFLPVFHQMIGIGVNVNNPDLFFWFLKECWHSNRFYGKNWV